MNNFEKTFETRYGNQTAETHYSVEFAGFGTWSLICNLNFEGERELYTLKTHDSEWIDELTYLQGEEKQDAIAERFWSLDTKETVLQSVVEWIETELEETDEECDLCYGEGQKAIKIREYSDGRGGYDIDCEFDDCPRCKGRGECSKAKNL
jgi:hypothetical protein